MADQSQNFSAPTFQGATVTTLYVERTMKVFALHEYEVENISSLNGEANIFFSIASAFITLAASIKINAAFYDQLTDQAKMANKFGVPLLGFIGLFFGFMAVRAVRKRSSILSGIKNQSRVTNG